LQCELAQVHLFEFAANTDNLDSSLKNDISLHLKVCDECSTLLRQIREMELTSTLWTDEEVPGWDRRRLFFGNREKFSWLQLTGALASVMVLVLILFRVEFAYTDSGFELSFAGHPDYVSNEELDSRLERLERENQLYLQASMNKLADRQFAANQLVLRAMLAANRSERREELATLMAVWQQDKRYLKESTEDSLRFLLRNQIEGRREMNSLTNVLNSITNQQDNNL